MRRTEQSIPLSCGMGCSHGLCRLLAMSEIEREGILAERAEELNKKKLRRDIAALVQLQDESVSAAAKRQHNAPGATKEKNRKLDELKAKRKAREEKGRVRGTISYTMPFTHVY
jgi:hypothetical protein